MTLSKISKAVIFLIFWVFLTWYVAVEAYDRGYHDGVKRTTEIFLESQK